MVDQHVLVTVSQHIAELPYDLRPPDDGREPAGRLGRVIAKVHHRVLGEHLVEAVPFAVVDEEAVKDDDGLDRESILGGALRRSRLVHWLSLSILVAAYSGGCFRQPVCPP